MNAERVNQIMRSPEPVKVMYNDRPVWIERIRDNNLVEITYLENQVKDVVPVMMLTEAIE